MEPTSETSGKNLKPDFFNLVENFLIFRLEGHKPTVVQIGSIFHFGASTRNYTLRERPKTTQNIVEDIPMSDQLSGLPENQDDVDVRCSY